MGCQLFHLTHWQTIRKHLWSLFSQICHIIREIRQFQQAPYRIEHQPKVSVGAAVSPPQLITIKKALSVSQVTQFLLDKTLVMDEDTLYELSLKIEPRVPPG